jgi:hypothetical protein
MLKLKKRYIIRDSGITAENFYKRIKKQAKKEVCTD